MERKADIIQSTAECFRERPEVLALYVREGGLLDGRQALEVAVLLDEHVLQERDSMTLREVYTKALKRIVPGPVTVEILNDEPLAERHWVATEWETVLEREGNPGALLC
jgi:hypothetical protein